VIGDIELLENASFVTVISVPHDPDLPAYMSGRPPPGAHPSMKLSLIVSLVGAPKSLMNVIGS